MKVRDLMSTDLITLSADDPLVAAEELMGLSRIRHLPVTEGGRLVGLVTHRDLMGAYLASIQTHRDWIAAQVLKAKVNVRAIMHSRIKTVGPDDDLVDAARQLLNQAFGCLPVVDPDMRLVGIVTEADFLRLSVLALQLIEREGRLEELAASLPAPSQQ